MPVRFERQNTVEEYFSVEEFAGVKHEFYQGQIFAMAGASLRHNRITGNIFNALRRSLEQSRCEVFAHDLRVRTPGGLYTYPDVMVVCNGVELSRGDRLDTVINPTAIVEVLSSSTAAYDRGEKFQLYRAFASLREYVLVDQSIRFVEHYSSQETPPPGADWLRREHTAATSHVTLASLAVHLSLADIYSGVELAQ